MMLKHEAVRSLTLALSLLAVIAAQTSAQTTPISRYGVRYPTMITDTVLQGKLDGSRLAAKRSPAWAYIVGGLISGGLYGALADVDAGTNVAGEAAVTGLYLGGRRCLPRGSRRPTSRAAPPPISPAHRPRTRMHSGSSSVPRSGNAARSAP